jgi:hypothetical protein
MCIFAHLPADVAGIALINTLFRFDHHLGRFDNALVGLVRGTK